MKTLKNIIYCATAAIVSLSAISCVEEVHAPGEAEHEWCYGVYFPAGQESAGANYIDPEDPTVLKFTASRLNREGDITVPVVVEASEEGIFEVSDIVFEDGQETTSFRVEFDKAEMSKTYSCRISIEDPMYAQIYGQNPFTLDFSVSRIKWNQVLGPNGEQTGKWRDDIISGMYIAAGYVQQYAEKDVEIYEREDLKGYYRIDNLYSQEYVESMIIPDLYGAFTNYTNVSLFIDATDPDKVWIANQSLGLNNSDMGAITIFSDVEQNLTPLGYQSNNLFGTLKNGVIEFPVRGLLMAEQLYFSNTSGKTRLILPGYKAYDYSLSADYGTNDNGNLPVQFTVGADVRKVKYTVFDGRYDDGQVFAAASGIAKGEIAEAKELDLQNTTVTVSGLETGFYTVVAVAFDAEDNNQGYTSVSFGYVAAGDEKPVMISGGLIVSDKYAPEGNTAQNSLEYYLYGQDIEDAYMLLYKTSQLQGATPNEIAQDLVAEAENSRLSNKELSQLNKGGLSGVVGGLSQGTDYTLAVYATNGYESTVYTVAESTEGEFNPIDGSYTSADLQPITEESDLFRTWNYYAMDFAVEEPVEQRQKIGQVKISDSSIPDDPEEGSYITLEGMLGPNAARLGLTDKLTFNYYKGIVYSLAEANNSFGNIEGYQSMFAFCYATQQGAAFGPYDYALVGGYVQDGYIAFVASPSYIQQQGVEFYGMGICLVSGQQIADVPIWYADMMLVDPSADQGAESASEMVSDSPLAAIRSQLGSPRLNYVETEDGRIRSIIDDVRSNPLKYARRYTSKDVPMRRDIKPVSFDAAAASEAIVPAPAGGSLLKLEKRF